MCAALCVAGAIKVEPDVDRKIQVEQELQRTAGALQTIG
jgi:hypothetical protein